MAKPRKRGLGKGLEALIPDMLNLNVVEEKVSEERIQMLPIDKIYPNPNQPRKFFNQENINELASSIKVHGIIQPIVVIPDKENYMIIAGERRIRAASSIGLNEVPCIVKHYDKKQLLEIALIENLQRQDLNVIEEARAYQYLIDQYNVKQDELSEALGKSRSYISNILRLLRLDKRVSDLIIAGEISGGHGRAILSIKSKDSQYELAKKVIKDSLSVRQVEKLVKELNNTEDKKKKVEKPKDIFVVEIEENLRSLFGTKVNIVKGSKKSKIEIEYYNEDDLDRILNLLN